MIDLTHKAVSIHVEIFLFDPWTVQKDSISIAAEFFLSIFTPGVKNALLPWHLNYTVSAEDNTGFCFCEGNPGQKNGKKEVACNLVVIEGKAK